ncbi:DUF4287 domain-containing protein [Nocardioides nanhaiensis]|uniref:Uncharacterized protein n=1 Tax=Nocardioides nanhaiensis TaxID=1476871 RepID=A0ABP8VRG2_9ACTN
MSEHEQGGTAALGDVEAAYGRTIPDWARLVRATPGYGDGGGALSREDLVSMMRSDYGMTGEHAEALIDHLLTQDRG